LTILGLGADLNAYAYVSGHIFKAIDPDGLDSFWPKVKQVVGGAASGAVSALVPGASIVELKTGKEFVEFASGKEKIQSSTYEYSKGIVQTG
jgi:hypothetical protein